MVNFYLLTVVKPALLCIHQNKKMEKFTSHEGFVDFGLVFLVNVCTGYTFVQICKVNTISGGGYHIPSALHSTDPTRVAKYSSVSIFKICPDPASKIDGTAVIGR